jgi:hypothetical protein
MRNFFRVPKDDESIDYDCGCIYRVKYTGESRYSSIAGKDVPIFDIEIDMFCVEHDVTLTEYAKEHEDEIADARK